MTRDFADFLAALKKEGVDYVVIGGIAVMSYVPYRATRDLDILIAPTLENAHRVRRAVASWGGFDPKYTAEEFISGDILSFGGLLRVEVHSRVPGVTWEELEANRVEGELAGVPTFFAGVRQLIAMKKATADPIKDLPDVERLERLMAEGSFEGPGKADRSSE